MKTSIQAIIVLLLVLIVVIGIYGAASGVLGNAGGNIEDGGEKSGTRLECVLSNPTTADSACKEDTKMEVKSKNDQKI